MVNENLFVNELNRFSGIGGEILINSVKSGDDPTTPGVDPDGESADPDLDGPIPPHVIQRIDVGDRLVGIGLTQTVECLSCSAEPKTTHTLGTASDHAKSAHRAFVVKEKVAIPGGFKFTFAPLSPEDYSATVKEASGGAVVLPAASIPEGTMVISFDDPTPNFTLKKIAGSPGMNWREASDGARHWHVGVAKPTDFWMSSFTSDDLGMLPLLSNDAEMGTIRFGLSLLTGGMGLPGGMKGVPCEGPSGTVMVDFCLSGKAVGTSSVDTPFPIGLKTEITFHPLGR